MKKILFIIFFCFVASTAFADHWVYIRTEDRSGLTVEDDKGRSKKGDVVAVLPVTPQYIPTEQEKKSYQIIRVSGLKQSEIDDMLAEDTEPVLKDSVQVDTKTKNFRKKKFELSDTKKGLKEGVLKAKDVTDKIKEKTVLDFARYRAKQLLYANVQVPIELVMSKVIPRAHAETISTINKTGEDYNTLQLWEDDKDGNLVGETRQETAECYDDDGDLGGTLNVAGSTVNSSYYMKVTVPQGDRHDGTTSSGFTLAPSLSGSYDRAIDVDDDYFRIEWVIIEITITDRFQRGIKLDSDGDYALVQNCIIVKVSGSNQSPKGVDNDGGSHLKLYNNIIYGFAGTPPGYGIRMRRSTDAYNNTLSDNDVGVYHDSASSETNNVYNNVSIGNDTDFSFAGSSNHDYNASSDATATGGNSLNSGSGCTPSTSDFETDGSDFHLADGACEIDKGNDYGSTANIDIDGRDRDSEGDTWDMGADEYVTVSSATRRIW